MNFTRVLQQYIDIILFLHIFEFQNHWYIEDVQLYFFGTIFLHIIPKSMFEKKCLLCLML